MAITNIIIATRNSGTDKLYSNFPTEGSVQEFVEDLIEHGYQWALSPRLFPEEGSYFAVLHGSIEGSATVFVIP